MLEALSKLGNDWTIFHSVRWQSVRRGRPGDWEADFIVMHPDRGLLVLEVKGGSIEVVGGRWYATSYYGDRNEIKNPYSQASDSKYALIEFFRNLKPPLRHVRVAHAVVFPAVEVFRELGPNAPLGNTLDAAKLKEPDVALHQVFDHWQQSCRLSTSDQHQIVGLLAPTVFLRAMLRTRVERSEADLIRLTQEQQDIFDRLKGMRELLVLGGPGTGKTLLALERARLLAKQGAKVRLVCYNELLGRMLRSATTGETLVDCVTFHGLCVREATAVGMKMPATPDVAWWDEEAPRRLVEAIKLRDPQIDALIVDEGQDFAPSWFAALRSDLVDESSPFYVFADDRQELQRRNWREGCVIEASYTLTENCRNTLPIATHVNALFGEPPPVRGAAGIEPRIRQLADDADVAGEVLDLAQNLMQIHGLSPSDVVILADDTTLVRKLRRLSVDQYPIVDYGEQGVVAVTVARFKGLESPAVVLVLTDADGRTADPTTTAYVGLSRARSAGFVLARQSHAVGACFKHSL
ncbi:MAG: NERD domain-containing protein [Rhodanobacteraceae bacterium]|nr:NERD domain-containing protein [Rhodanobacteraceae bacterium]